MKTSRRRWFFALASIVVILALFVFKNSESEPYESIQHAAYNNDVRAVDEFLDAGVDIDERTEDWPMTALQYAVTYGYYGLASHLLERGADVDASIVPGSEQRLNQFALDGDEKVLRLFEEANIELSDGLSEEESGAMFSGIESATALWIAVNRSNPDMVRLLLNYGADIERTGQGGSTPLTLASITGSDGMVSLLLQRGADANARDVQGVTPVLRAVGEGHIETVEVLLTYGAKTAIDDGMVQSAIPWAAVNNQREMLEYLLAQGLDVNKPGSGEFTALHQAANYDNVELADFLLENGAEVNRGTGNNITPLALAAVKGNAAMTRWLIENGSEIEAAVESTGKTPLHLAVQDEHIEVVRILLEAGADPLAEAIKGYTPLDLAYQLQYEDIAALVESFLPEP